MAKGYHKRQEEQFNLVWDPARHVLAMLHNIYRGKDDPALTPREYMPLSCDPKEEPKEVKVLSPEQQEELIKKRQALRNGRRNIS